MVSRKKKLFYRWERLSFTFRVILILVAVFTLVFLVYKQQLRSGFFEQGGLFLYSVLNINVIALCGIAFIVGRNVVKLFFDRKKGLLGSGIKLKLVTAFVGLTLVPTVILFVLASGVLSQLMENLIDGKQARLVKSNHYLAEQHTSVIKDRIRDYSLAIKEEILRDPLVYSSDALLKELFKKKINKFNLNEIILYNAKSLDLRFGFKRNRSGLSEISIESYNLTRKDRLEKLTSDEPVKVFLEFQERSFVRSYAQFDIRNNNVILVCSSNLSNKLVKLLKRVHKQTLENVQITLFKDSLKSGYLVSLGLITLLLIFAAIWIAFYIARDLSGPIAQLLEATRAIARGKYSYRVKVTGNDELSLLTKAFNKMTEDLEKTRSASELRGQFIETIQAQLAVGVIAISKDYSIISINENALRIINEEDSQEVLGSNLFKYLESDVSSFLQNILSSLNNESEDSFKSKNKLKSEQIFKTKIDSEEKRILCTAGVLKTGNLKNKSDGYLLLFDDVTDLVKAQEIVAWREVARRIAHEIKNPLTPLQLSVQRLQRAIPSDDENNLHNLASIILTHINSIKRLADEFSRFSRMPVVSFENYNLNKLISGVLGEFSERYPDLVFKFLPDNKVSEVFIDSEQIRRVFYNLFDNAAQAFLNEPNQNQRVTVITKKESDQVKVEVFDNGPGLDSKYHNQIFEPYFTKTPGGTGLGLSIVSSIIEDHNGSIEIDKTYQNGCKFIIRIPLTYKEKTKRNIHA